MAVFQVHHDRAEDPSSPSGTTTAACMPTLGQAMADLAGLPGALGGRARTHRRHVRGGRHLGVAASRQRLRSAPSWADGPTTARRSPTRSSCRAGRPLDPALDRPAGVGRPARRADRSTTTTGCSRTRHLVGPVFDASQDVAGDYRLGEGIRRLVVDRRDARGDGRRRGATAQQHWASSATAVAISAALASGYIDNARYLLGAVVADRFGRT